MRILNLCLAVLFTVFACLQYNDPDPWRWALMYGFVAGICAFAAFGRQNKHLMGLGIVACLVWMAVWLPDFLNWISIGRPDIAEQMKAETPSIEFAREFFGLLLCLLVLVWQRWRLREK